MGRVLTNNSALSYSVESALGTAGNVWTELEPNDIGTYGATTTTVSREPISKDRARRKGTITDLESAVEFESDLTMSALADFGEGFAMATSPTGDLRWRGVSTNFGASTVTILDGLTATQAAKLTYNATGAKSLLFVSGFGFEDQVVSLNATAASTDTTLTVSPALATSAAADQQTVEIAGVQCGASDISITVVSGVATVTSGGDVANWTTLGVRPGMTVWIGNRSTTTGSRGFARVSSIDGADLVLDKLDSTIVNGSSLSSFSVMFGQFYRNVPTDDTWFLERTYQFELTMPNLIGGSDGYEYAKGNYANTLSLNVPLADKATCSWGFIGTDTEVPTSTRKTHSRDHQHSLTEAFNTSSDVLRLRVTDTDENAMTTCFKDFTLTLNNNVSPEKCIGALGASYMNTGNFFVDLEAEALFTDEAVVTAIRNNETVTLDAIIRNNNGAIALDVPSLTLGDGSKSFPVNESVTISLSGQAFNDSTIGTSVGVSTLPGVPAA